MTEWDMVAPPISPPLTSSSYILPLAKLCFFVIYYVKDSFSSNLFVFVGFFTYFFRNSG